MNTSVAPNLTETSSSNVRWTTSDLEGFPDNGNRYEIVDGELLVTLAPHWDHQDLAAEACMALRQWSKQTGLGQASFTPGIIYSESDNVIPDVVWVSTDRLAQLLDESGHLTGSPELVVEVLSKPEADRKRDRQTKLKLYSAQGVMEYWIIDGEQKQLEVYRREQGLLTKVATFYRADCLTSPLLPGFNWELSLLFD